MEFCRVRLAIFSWTQLPASSAPPIASLPPHTWSPGHCLCPTHTLGCRDMCVILSGYLGSTLTCQRSYVDCLAWVGPTVSCPSSVWVWERPAQRMLVLASHGQYQHGGNQLKPAPAADPEHLASLAFISVWRLAFIIGGNWYNLLT